MNVIFHAVNRRRELKFLESLVAKHVSLFGVSEDEREDRKWTTAGVSTPFTSLPFTGSLLSHFAASIKFPTISLRQMQSMFYSFLSFLRAMAR